MLEVGLEDVRNFRSFRCRPAAGINFISGSNGQGKTNLLEALGLLVTGRSFRAAKPAEIVRHGGERAELRGQFHGGPGTRVVTRMIARRPEGAWGVTGEGCPWARAVAFGWQDLAVVYGGAGGRRACLDGFAARLWPAHRTACARLREVVTRRNAILQDPALSPGQSRRDLEPWDAQLAGIGAEVTRRRREAAGTLQAEASRIYPALAGVGAKVELRYQPGAGDGSEADLRRALEERRDAERRRRITLVGPQRDEVALELGGVDTRAYASRGQQRLLALALRLAEIVPVTAAAGTAPVLLLDDALSELDAQARAGVLREIAEVEQVFLTGPDPVVAPTGSAWTLSEEGGLAPA